MIPVAIGAATKLAPMILGKGGAGKAASSMGGAGGGGGMPKPPTGQIIGAGMNLATGLLQTVQAAKLKKKADSSMPPLIDPRQASFLSELNQKRKSIDTGADFSAGMNAINTTNSATNQAITQNAGGDSAAAIQGLLQSERTAADAKNNVIAQGQGQQMQYNSMFNDLNNKIAARSLQIQMQKSQQLRGEWAQKKQMGTQNLMAGAAGAASILGGMGGDKSKGGGTPAAPAMPAMSDRAPAANAMAGSPVGAPAGKPDISFLTNLMPR